MLAPNRNDNLKVVPEMKIIYIASGYRVTCYFKTEMPNILSGHSNTDSSARCHTYWMQA